MSHQSIRRGALTGLLTAVFALAFAGTCRADTIVLRGWDLLETVQPTTFDPDGPGPAPPITFVGVPLVTFDFTSGTGGDFGRGIGAQNTGGADTIIKRLEDASAPSTQIRIELLALRLASASTIDLGAGMGTYFVTLQSARGGPASTGMMTINFGPEGVPHGSFTTDFLDVLFDIRFGSLTGPVVFSGQDRLSAGGCWSHLPPREDNLEIPGVNVFLNGQDRNNDFWFARCSPDDPGIVRHNGNISVHSVQDTCEGGRCAPVPEPATVLLLGTGLAGVAAVARRRRKSSKGNLT